MNFFLLLLVILLGWITGYCAWRMLFGVAFSGDVDSEGTVAAVIFGSLALTGFILLGDLWVW